MIKYKHIIITRFNLPQRWKSDKKGNIVLDTIWLKDRFNLFQNFCLPSMIGQTSKNFEWWVYFDINTESSFKKIIEDFEKKYSNFIAKYEKNYDSFEVNMPIDISNKIKKENKDWLITTRLDNDDMLAKDTVEILQKKLNYQNNILLEIPWGYTLEMGQKSKLRKVRSQLNPFISYVEKVEIDKVIKSVYFHQHTEWRDIKSVIVTNRPQWVQVIHSKNLINGINGEPVSPLNFYSRFIFNKKKANIKVSYKILASQVINRFKLETLARRILKIKLIFK